MADPMPSVGSTHAVEEAFTEAEIKAFYDTRDLLLAKGFKKEDLEQRTLFLTVINCKLRPESAAEKYKKLLENLKLFNITSYPQIWAGLDDSPEGEAEWAKIKPLLTAYGGAGRDKQDRGIMWIRTRGITPEEETLAVRTSIIYWFCVHADMRSLREGITFVLDTTHNDFDRKHGNESKLQRTWQSIPLRPQRIFIHGANYIKRVIINALLTVASYFTSEKVIERIRFADLPEILTEVSIAVLSL